MTLPILVPRPSWLVAPIAPKPQSVLTHDDSEWAAIYPEVKRLYVHERRKLRYVMQYAERKHGFRATEQMYKKRFAKWGFRKNSRHSDAPAQSLATTDKCRRVATTQPSTNVERGFMPASPRLDQRDVLTLMFLSSVRTWSVSFFESMQTRDGLLVSQQHHQPLIDRPLSANPRQISFTFKLVTDLLGRGHGDLAGRMARKAFLLLEDMLTLDGPALAWILLEMMYEMVKLRHAQLFQILLAHLHALAGDRMSANHPLPNMLRGLRGLVASLTSAASISKSSPTSDSSSPPTILADCDGPMASTDLGLLLRVLPSLLERAWILNTEILLDRFDPRLLQLYFCIPWDSCSITPPAAIVGAAGQWFSQIEAYQISSTATEVERAEGLPLGDTVEEDRMLQHLLAPRIGASPPRDYEMLRTRSLETLRDYGHSILSKGAGFTGDTSMLLAIVAGLVKAKVLDGLPAVGEKPNTANTVRPKVPRVYAGNFACVIRTLMDLEIEHGSGGFAAFSDTVERIRAVVTLREYAQGETDPQVVREMLLLENALVMAGEYAEAQEVRRDAYNRLEKYIKAIPIDHA